MVTPRKHESARLNILKAWNAALIAQTGELMIDYQDVSLVNETTYNEFRVSGYNPDAPFAPPTSIIPDIKPKFVAPKVKNAADEFKRGSKRDKTHYTTLNDEKQWDDWKRSTLATIYAHDCENVTKPTYRPTSPDDTALFKEQNKFMYDVFTSIIKTHSGKHFVRKYEHNRNAQAVWNEYVTFMRSSTRGDIEIEELMTDLTSLRLSQNYRGTTMSFITEWLNKLKKYEEMTPTDSHFTDSMKKNMLQNAVSDLQPFKAVKTSEQLEIAKGNGPIAYQQYITLLWGVASQYDKDLLPKQNRSNRLINMHLTNDETIYEYEEEGFMPNITQSHDYFVNETHSRRDNKSQFRRRPSLHNEIWKNLTLTDQAHWDKISTHGKWNIINGIRRTMQDKPSGTIGHQQKVNKLTIFDKDIRNQYEDDTHPSSLDQLPQTTDDSFLHDNHILINAATSHTDLDPSDIRRVLSDSVPSKLPQKVNEDDTRLEDKKKLKFKASLHQYKVSTHDHTSPLGALVDRGANGGIAGNDIRVITKTDRMVDVSGIDNHEMTNLQIVTAGGVVKSQRGNIIVILNQFAHVPNGKTILSSIQLESFGNLVDDKSVKLKSGKQIIVTLDGYVLPLNFSRGLAYLSIRPFTDEEWETLQHVVLTADNEWDPSIYDLNVGHRDFTLESFPDHVNEYELPPIFTINADSTSHPVRSNFYKVRTHLIQDEIIDRMLIASTNIISSQKDYNKLKEYFLNVPIDVIARTFDATTQYAQSGWITGHIENTYKSPFPALSCRRRNEYVATDTVYSDTPVIDNGSTCAQVFVGKQSKFSDVFGMRTDSQFVDTLMDVIRKRGAMDQLVSDRAQVEISTKVKDILRHLCIDDWQSEPHYQHQNFAERRYKAIKRNVNMVLNKSGAPAHCWLLAMEYVCFIMNRMALKSLKWRTPYEVLYGSTPDISMIYRFKFYDRIYGKRDDSRGGVEFPSQSNEFSGRFVGFSENVGHKMTYKVLADESNKILFRSRIKLASIDSNARLEDMDQNQVSQDTSNEFVKRRGEHDTEIDNERRNQIMADISLDDLIGRTYLTDPAEDGTRRRLTITKKLEEDERNRMSSPEMIKFQAKTNDETYDEIITYNQIIDKLEAEDGENSEWRFKAIVDHEGPLQKNHSRYRGSRWNLKVHWENDEVTWEPLAIIAKSDPITCAIYARDNDLLELEGWKQFRRLANRQRKLLRMANQAKLKSYKMSPVYKFGVLVPRNHQQAMEIDLKNGNSLWREAELRELQQIDEYQTFIDNGNTKPPPPYKKIRVHMVYDVKPTLMRKARLVADGHLTEVPLESVYSSVVSLRGLKICIFISELNGLETWTTDIGNAYLEAFTEEKVYIIAGPEFGEREGRVLIISKALYGLKSSGLRWWERFSNILNAMGFFPSKAEDDIWMRNMGTHYDYIARYVDDLAIVSRDPETIIEVLKETHKLKLKGSGPLKYHLGCSFWRDEQGTLCMSPAKYIERIVDNYTRMFGTKPRTSYTSPLNKGDHPELDDSDELDIDGIKKYQSLIGALQWVITIGRFDIGTAIMTLSSFRVAPRVGHLDRLKRIIGYLCKMKNGAIRFRTKLPDYSQIPIKDYDWQQSVYGNVQELVPSDAPTPYGPDVIITTYVDANLCHDMTTGKSVTGIIHLLNQTVIDYYTKKQPVVETATYGSEFMAARTATEQIMDLRTTLRYLGVHIHGPTYMFGDNKTVVDSASTPKARLHKRHVILSFHRTREAIAAKVLNFIFTESKNNPADLLSKHWGYQQVRIFLKALLFWHGDTINITSK